MFIKTTKAKGYEYIKLVESYKENGKVKHHVLYNFGRADILRNDESFIRIVKRLSEISGHSQSSGKDTAEKWYESIGEGATLYNYGYIAYRKLWETLGICDSLEETQGGTRLKFPLEQTVFLMAITHLLKPMSKYASYQRQERYFNLPEVHLHHMYRALEQLSKHKEEIETYLFECNYIRVKKHVDVVFYDVTTFAFESTNADDLRNFGYSKDCKFNEVQVVMGMIIDSTGVPVGYELFPGNTFDGNTMVKALENIKKRFGIHRVVIVADRGLNSKNNLNLITEAGYGYIMSSKIRSMGKAMQEKALETEGFTPVSDSSGTEVFRYKVMDYQNTFKNEDKTYQNLSENLIISYSAKRARKDRADRERLIAKAEKLLEDPEKIKASNKRGGKKYINQTGGEKPVWELASDKIEEDARFDGYYGIQTSEKNMSATEVMDAYHTLWKIEESFRVMKSTMEIRPVFLWNTERIKGHFVVCFLAFLMERKMELLLKSEQDDVISSPMRIQEALNTMQLAAVSANGDDFFIKVKPDSLGCKIFKQVGLTQPAPISTKTDLLTLFKLDESLEDVQMAFF